MTHISSTISLILLAAIATNGPAGCDRQGGPRGQSEAENAKDARPSVYTTFYPTTYMAQRIGGGAVDVRCPVPVGEDPVFWQPTAAQIAEYQKADLIVINGAAYEHWVDTAALPLAKVIDTASPFASEFINFKTTTHSHGAGGAHSHTGVDGHTWMDPLLATRQAQQIETAFSHRWPDRAKGFQKNLAELASDLQALSERFARLVPQLKACRLLANHPAYAYLARRYGLSVEVIDVDPEIEPTDLQWKTIETRLAGLVRSDDDVAVIMLFESAPVPAIAQRLSTLKVRVVEFDPCESAPSGDSASPATYLTVMNSNIDRLSAAVAQSVTPAQPAESPRR